MTDIKQPIGRTERDGASTPSLWQLIARSRSKEVLERKRQVEEGPYHPTEELLREYVLDQLDESDAEIIMDHLSLCGPCAREALRLRWKLRDQTGSLWDKVSNFISSLSFPVSIHAPALEAVRGASEDKERRYTPGTELTISVEAPADGYVTVFHGCEETGESKLVFPWQAKDNPRVSEGQRVQLIRGDVEGPPGKHFLKVFWTRERPPDPRKFDLHNDEQREQAEREFFDVLCNLNEEDWRTATRYYEVIEG
jgi:hypothetical protein